MKHQRNEPPTPLLDLMLSLQPAVLSADKIIIILSSIFHWRRPLISSCDIDHKWCGVHPLVAYVVFRDWVDRNQWHLETTTDKRTKHATARDGERDRERKERLTHLVVASKAVHPSLGFRGSSCDVTREGKKRYKGCCICHFLRFNDAWIHQIYLAPVMTAICCHHQLVALPFPDTDVDFSFHFFYRLKSDF